jgi:hypothetical protein
VRPTAVALQVNAALAGAQGMVMGVGHGPEILHVRCKGQKRPIPYAADMWEADGG